MTTSTCRLAILLSHPIQYFSPLFRRLAATPGLDLTVLYCSDAGATVTRDPEFETAYKWDVPLLDGYTYQILPRASHSTSYGFFRHINPRVISEIRSGHFDALVVHGHNFATNWLAFAGARFAGVPIIMRGESHLLNEPTGYKRVLKRSVLHTLYQHFAGALPIGCCNSMHYRSYGFRPSQLVMAPYSVDNDFFAAADDKLRPERVLMRKALGVCDARPLILYCGKLVAKKQPLSLLEAYEHIRRQYNCALVYAGDGPLRRTIETAVLDRNIPDVRITGFLNQTQLPAIYVAADVLVLPSRREPWGLVVNEAMNFGLPIVASDRVGAAYDIVKQGENGIIFKHNDTSALSTALGSVVSDSALRWRYGQRSREIIDDWGLKQCAAGFRTGVLEFGRASSRSELDQRATDC